MLGNAFADFIRLGLPGASDDFNVQACGLEEPGDPVWDGRGFGQTAGGFEAAEHLQGRCHQGAADQCDNILKVASKVTSKQLTEGNHDYRPLLKEIKKSEETHIVLDCDFERIPGILHQANEIELLTDYHNYLVTSLDMDKINLEKYKDMVRMGKRMHADNAEEGGYRFPERPNLARKTPWLRPRLSETAQFLNPCTQI